MQVGSAVLLLSRFVGLQWNADEAVRLAEEKTTSASEAVNRLSDNVGTLEQRLTAVEEPEVGGARGALTGGGGATPTHTSPAGAGTVAHEAKFAEGGSGGGGAPPDDPDHGIVSSPSLLRTSTQEAAAGTASVARKAKNGAKRSSRDLGVRSDQNFQQASAAESTRNYRPSSLSRNGGDDGGGDDIAAPSASGRSDSDVGASDRVDGDGGESDEDSSSSGGAGPGRRSDDSDGEHGSSRRRSGGGDGGGRRTHGRYRPSVEGHPIDQPLLGPAAEQDVVSLSSSGRKDDQVLQQPSTGRLPPLRISRVPASTDGGGGSIDAVGMNLNTGPHGAATGAAAPATVSADGAKEQAALMGGAGLDADTNSRRLSGSADNRILSPSRAEQEQQAHELSGATGEVSPTVLHESVDGEGDQDRDELKGAKTGENASSTASEKPVAGSAATAVEVASEVNSSVTKNSAMEGEGGRKNGHAGRVDADTGPEAKPTDTLASSVVLASSSSSSTSESSLAGSSSGGESSAIQEGADEKEQYGDKDDDARVLEVDGERGRSTSAAGEPASLAAAGSAGTALPGDDARGSFCSNQRSIHLADQTFKVPREASSPIKLDPMEPQSTGGGSAEGAAEVSETARRSTGRIHGTSHDAKFTKTRVSKEVEDGERVGQPISSGRLSAPRQETGGTSPPMKVEKGVAAVVAAAVSGASDKFGGAEGGSGAERSFSDDSSRTSGSSSWTSRTGDSRSSSQPSTASSTRASSSSEKGRTADSTSGKSSSSSGGIEGRRRRRSRSSSKKSQVTDGVGCVAGREDAIGARQVVGDHQSKMVAVSDERRASGQHVDSNAAIAIAAVAAAHLPQQGPSVSLPPSGPGGVADQALEVETDDAG